MSKRRLILIVVAGVVCVEVLVGLAMRESEPEYQGKKLSEWVERYDRIPMYPSPGIRPLYQTESDEAIRRIGTKAIPYLLKWIRYERATWKRELYSKVNAMLTRMKHSWRFQDKEHLRQLWRARRSIDGLRALDAAAEPAIADLMQLVAEPRGKGSAGRAVVALNELGHPVPREALGMWTNRIEVVVVSGPGAGATRQLPLFEAANEEVREMWAEENINKQSRGTADFWGRKR